MLASPPSLGGLDSLLSGPRQRQEEEPAEDGNAQVIGRHNASCAFGTPIGKLSVPPAKRPTRAGKVFS
jgi:hypothetical protein